MNVLFAAIHGLHIHRMGIALQPNPIYAVHFIIAKLLQPTLMFGFYSENNDFTSYCHP